MKLKFGITINILVQNNSRKAKTARRKQQTLNLLKQLADGRRFDKRVNDAFVAHLKSITICIFQTTRLSFVAQLITSHTHKN